MGDRRKAWRQAEVDVLAEEYQRDSRDTPPGVRAASRLPGRTAKACEVKASKLGLSDRSWSDAEDTRLVRLWGEGLTLSQIAHDIGRTEYACRKRWYALGGRGGCPRGWITVTAASRKYGLTIASVRRIAKRAGLGLRPYPSTLGRSTSGRLPRGARGMYWEAELELAIMDRLEREPMTAAARRLGVGAEYLKLRLYRAGYRPPRDGVWLVSDEEVRQAVTEYVPRQRRGAEAVAADNRVRAKLGAPPLRY